MELKYFVLDFRFLYGGLRFVCYVINAMRNKTYHSREPQYKYNILLRYSAVVN